MKGIQPQPAYTFTLAFKSGAIAPLQVFGATTQDEARTVAASVLPQSCYEVKDGAPNSDDAFCFYSCTCTNVQEQHTP